MPIYEYRCAPCQHTFETFLATSSEQAVCPQCQGVELQRLMSTFAASVPGGYKSAQSAAAAAAAAPAPKAGGCGGGCACH